MSQTINLNDMEAVSFNDKEVEFLQLNNVEIWSKLTEDQLQRLLEGTIVTVSEEELEGLTDIRPATFADCTLLESVTLPNTITTIHESAFYQCTSLTNINIPNNLISLGDACFKFCYVLNNIVLPDTLKSIDSEAFSHCSSLTSIIMPDTVESIGRRVFVGCSSLITVKLSNILTEIPENTFTGCDALGKVIIPATVTKIESNAFIYNNVNIRLLSETPPSIASNSFDTLDSIDIIEVPMSSVDAYKTATYWRTYADKIVGY